MTTVFDSVTRGLRPVSFPQDRRRTFGVLANVVLHGRIDTFVPHQFLQDVRHNSRCPAFRRMSDAGRFDSVATETIERLRPRLSEGLKPDVRTILSARIAGSL